MSMYDIDYEDAMFSDDIVIGEFTLKMVCYACPEAYDVYKDGVMVAYYRLRHGKFTVWVPDYDGKKIMEVKTIGDGIFMDGERESILLDATNKLREYDSI